MDVCVEVRAQSMEAGGSTSSLCEISWKLVEVDTLAGRGLHGSWWKSVSKFVEVGWSR